MGMIPEKNTKLCLNFVKVMPRILWLLFFGHGVYTSSFVSCILADPTVRRERSMNGSWHHNVVCPSVCLSLRL